MKLLLVEDDAKLAGHLSANLREHGFLVSLLSDEPELQALIDDPPPRIDVIVLDRLLGSHDSKESLPAIRRRWPRTPILILSAISTPNERTELLNLGADDYLGKPFSTQELLARIRALLRRGSAPAGAYLKVGDLILDSVRRVMSVGDASEALPAKEFLLLRALCQEPGRIWNKHDLLDYVWGQAATVETNVVEATVTHLRRRLSDLGTPVSIRNMRNAGYWIAE
jgi:DNA-binding response OmpR family regulator